MQYRYLYFQNSHATSFLLQVRVDKRINVTAQIAFGVTGLKVCTVILDDIVRVNSHSTNLSAKVSQNVFALELCCFVSSLLLL